LGLNQGLNIIPEKLGASSAYSAELSMGIFGITSSSSVLDIASEQVSDSGSALTNKELLALEEVA
jgi:hypothetical protein